MISINFMVRSCLHRHYRSLPFRTNYFRILYLYRMSRELSSTQTLMVQRVKMKEKFQKYAPGTISLQVLGSGAKGAPRSLYLFTDQSRYLFNCGEGTQRLAHEHKMKLSKLEHIFITYNSWSNLGGLPGVALTLQDVGVPQIILHGPDGIEQIFSATNRFIVLSNLSIRKTSIDNYEDNAIKVTNVPLKVMKEKHIIPEESNSVEEGSDDNIDYYQHEKMSPNGKRQNVQSLSVQPTTKRVGDEDISMCYVVQLQPKPGALCLEKCVEAGVPPGPLLGKLKNGEDVILNNGTTVRSKDVTFPLDPGPLFIVVEVPDERFLTCLPNTFLKYQQVEKNEDVPYVVVHFTPDEIMKHPIYQEWMQGFSEDTHHLLMNDANNCMGSTAVHRIQYKLNVVEPSLFPLLQDKGFRTKEESALKENKGDSCKFSLIKGRTTCRINLRPRSNFILSSYQQPLTIDPEGYRNEVLSIHGISRVLSSFKNNLEELNSSLVHKEHPNILFLGTGSCIPNKVRNTSSILLTLSEDCRLMLDCGEGTFGQIVRHFGPEEIIQVLSSLQAVFISHLHADHHLGLVGLLRARPNSSPPLFLIAPPQIMTWLRFYHITFEPILEKVQLVSNHDLLYTKFKLCGPPLNKLYNSLNMEKIETTFVRHCPHAFGVCLTSKDGWRITYSGDTMPSEDLIELGQDCDLLIHEATMEDDLVQEARIKLHCTTSEAIKVGQRMRAKFTILTHFSQRYAKLPRIGADGLGERIGVAFDNMKVRLTDLPKLSHIYPVLKLVFKEDCDDLEVKALKRQMKAERSKLRDSVR